jgi:hypothetical protein
MTMVASNTVAIGASAGAVGGVGSVEGKTLTKGTENLKV